MAPLDAFSRALVIAGAVLALVGVIRAGCAPVGGSQRGLLTVAGALTLGGILRAGATPFSPAVGLAWVALATAAATLYIRPVRRAAYRLGGIAIVVAAGALALLPRSTPPYLYAPGLWPAVGRIGLALAAGTLLAGIFSRSADNAGSRLLSSAWCLQTVGLLGHGVGARQLWGAYWSRDPLECWLLAAWLVTAIAAWGERAWGWGERRPYALVIAPAIVALFVLFGALPLLHVLGTSSLFLR
ncbi:MAG TPA: hypothetical protein GX702_00640 [Chloroflexi bacterium]|nr:hypothetical protein [Chloroflexota bacterium]